MRNFTFVTFNSRTQVRIKGWKHIKRVSQENTLIDGCWLNGVLENSSIHKYVLRRNLSVFSGLKSTKNEIIREYCSSAGIMQSKKACEWDVVGFCDFAIRPLSVRINNEIRYMSDLSNVLDRDVAVFVAPSSRSDGGDDDKSFETKLRLAAEYEETFQIRTCIISLSYES